jgi:hypothetical protein
MPTKRDAAQFGCKQWIEDAFQDMAVIPEDVASYSAGTVAEQVCSKTNNFSLKF